MKVFGRLSPLAAVGLCLLSCACPKASLREEQAFSKELAARNRQRGESVRLCRAGLDAYEAGDLEQARERLKGAVAADRGNAHAWVALGVVEFARNDASEAAFAFETAMGLEPARYEPRFNLGAVLESTGQYARAARLYEQALRLAPGQLEVMENLARCYIRGRMNLNRAKELVDKALESEARPEWRLWLESQSDRIQSRLPEERGWAPPTEDL
jgi:Tfp pilus assembly protein PilF